MRKKKSDNLHPKPEYVEKDYLDVGDGHEIYYEVSGPEDGYPILYLHGGPGAGTSGAEHRYFDTSFYKVILFDQRGAGKSKPYAETNDNSPEHLLSDIENLRKHLDISSWAICGGSWGSTLGLLYATKYPQHVTRMLLRGIFFGDYRGSLHIIEAHGAASIQPEYFQQYAEAPYVPEAARHNLTQAYHDILMYGDKETQIEAAMRFDIWDNSIAYAQPNTKALDFIRRNPERSLGLSKLFFHFVVNHYAHKDYKHQIISKLEVLQKMPIDIIHGECDWICPVENAIELKRRCPNANLNIVLAGGHTVGDPIIKQEIIDTLERWKEELEE